MEGKEVYFPRLIKHSMWRAHIHGLLPFPTLVTNLVELADVPWEDDDMTPTPPEDDDKEVTIPWGGWVHEKPPTSCRSRARAVVEAARPSSSTAAGPASSSAAAASLPPPPGIELPPLPNSPASDEQDQEELAEEPTHQDAPPETQATIEVQQPPEDPQPYPEPQPVPVSQPEPEPQPDAIDYKATIGWKK
ncbi:circumsporozoite protein-like [Arachis ipaensis]|uniref:circumsporozoite protein-like n=1 Tax=Arachis ipaensis TaxID=130454 RepID=UPI0007AF1329|nr:circumsporozoite protein-like [Arachis ipaensis]